MMKRSTYNVIIISCCALMMIFSFFISRKKNTLKEAKKLPFYNTQLENVADGIYEQTTNTSFMHLTLDVTVKDHKLTKIDIVKNEGSAGKKVEEITEKMIAENKVIVDLINGEEVASLVFLSCVDGAISQGVIDNGQVDLSN